MRHVASARPLPLRLIARSGLVPDNRTPYGPAAFGRRAITLRDVCWALWSLSSAAGAEALEQADGHGVAGLLADGLADVGFDRELMGAVPEGP